jgi:hypothetical protein
LRQHEPHKAAGRITPFPQKGQATRAASAAVADTHALVWALLGDDRLSPAARAALSVTGNDQIRASNINDSLVAQDLAAQAGPAALPRVHS